ncbi:MAG: MerR family transcriptional regulator [Oscillospiraceae bacterium]|nr:MerR family transcriptional regulator [Oscillospiraceae bacterium]
MNDLIKIKEVSSKYDITARTLRYYEDMGLIVSTRSTDYAYRLYDETAIKRLEQVLILRKLNISIRDIQRIFSASGSEVVLEVLDKKVQNIDDEVALLHELKEIVLGFIQQIEKMDFNSDANVKMLYEKAKEIETQLVNIDYIGKPSNVNRLIEVTEKLKKAPEVRVIRVNPFRAFTSGTVNTDVMFGTFGPWQETHKHLLKNILYGAQHFMWIDEDKDGRHYGEWIWAVEDWVSEDDVAPYKLIEFVGGLYAVAVSIDDDHESLIDVYNMIMKWIDSSGFEYEERHECEMLMNIPNPDDDIKNALGYHQLEIFIPIKIREK